MYVGFDAREVLSSWEQNGDIGAVEEAVWSWNEAAERTLGWVRTLGPDLNFESAATRLLLLLQVADTGRGFAFGVQCSHGEVSLSLGRLWTSPV